MQSQGGCSSITEMSVEMVLSSANNVAEAILTQTRKQIHV